MTPTMELNDTVDLMTSSNYKDRFKAEYYQLENRFTKLNEMLLRWDLGKLDFKPTCPRTLYGEQLSYMRNYLDVLRRRSKTEGIEL